MHLLGTKESLELANNSTSINLSAEIASFSCVLDIQFSVLKDPLLQRRVLALQCDVYGFPRYVNFCTLTDDIRAAVVKNAVQLFIEHEFSPLIARKFCFMSEFVEEL